MSKHYDSYGHEGRSIYHGDPMGLMPIPLVKGPCGHHRYLIWVSDSATSAFGYWKTFRTRFFAIRRAQLLQEMGHGVRVVDRKILPGDAGFLADRSGSYFMTQDGVLILGECEVIKQIQKAHSSV